IALIPVGSSVKSLAFTEGKHLVLVAADRMVRTVEVLNRLAFKSLSVPGTIGISPRGRYLITFSGPNTPELTIVDRQTGEKLLRLAVPADLVTSGVIRYSLDEEYLVTAGSVQGTTTYEIKTGKSHHKPPAPGLVAETISNDGKTVGWATASNIEIFSTDDSRQDRLEFSNTHLLE